jgi:hypothetical protein
MRTLSLALFMMTVPCLPAAAQNDLPADYRLPESFLTYRITDRMDYTGEDLYDYINGGAELYLSYGLTRMTGCKYNADGLPQLTVEIYEMTSPENAFGVYTQSRDKEEREFGQGSQSFHDFILFWKGRYFVTVYTQAVTPESEAAIKYLATLIDETAPAAGAPPRIVDILPKEGLAEAGFLYFHHYIWLNAYFFIADYNIIDLNDETDAVLAKYGSADARSYLLIVEYPSGERAADAFQKLREGYAPELTAAQPFVELEDGTWFTAWTKENRLGAIFNGNSQEETNALYLSTFKNM